MNLPKIYLSSTSPRRQMLLKQIGVPFTVIAIEVDEEQLPNESPDEYAERLSQQKALAGQQHPDIKENRPILAADTIVVLKNTILGKPKEKNDYLSMLASLSGHTHTVITAITVLKKNQLLTKIVKTLVSFRSIEPAEMEFYWQQYHPSDKAGGYGIQDFAAVFVEKIEGSYTNVVGLPLMETYQLLSEMD